MDIKQIKQVIELMKRAELNEFSVEEEGFKLKIRRGHKGGSNGANRNSAPPFVVAAEPAVQAAIPSIAVPAPATLTTTASGDDEVGMTFIKSPMVGTFYRSPSPDSKAFADVGTKVEASTLVCIIEAMKIMNEIQAEVKGTIVEVLAEDGDPIEYGQKLFKVKSS
ncbi:MAG: acetyl-CoA carboxylase biotin carboxyl carrier protein [Verrucomicrobiia bacterium]